MTDHLATGDIDVTYGNLPEGTDASVDATVALMAEMAKGKFGARSPKIRAAAINIINGIDPLTGKRIGMPVGNKDYFGMLEAIHNYVRDNIRYVKDVVGQETLSYPEETLFNSRGGDCDDMTILEIALLGSIGLRSYPVVIGLVPNHFSHVYLHAEIPNGRHRHAGKTFAADPIMREWSLGMAAPDDRVKNKRTYPHLAGLGTMSLRGYADGPSYLSPLDEQEATQVPAVLKSRYVDTGSRGEIVNTKRLTEWGDELDDMFNRANTLRSPMQAAPAFELYNRGPVTNRGEKVLTSYLHEAKPVRNISAPFGTPIPRGPRIVTVVDKKAAPRKNSAAPSVGELMGLADYLADLEGPAKAAGRRSLVSGKSDVIHRAAALAVLAKQRAKKASGRVVNWERNSGFLFGLGSLEASQQLNAAKQIEQLAHQIAAKAQLLAEACAGDSPARQSILRDDLGALDYMDSYLGVVDAVAEVAPAAHPRIDAQEKVDTLLVIAGSPTFREAALLRASPESEAPAAKPIVGVMPGGIVRDQNGRVIYRDDGSDDGLAGSFGKKLKKRFKKSTRIVKKVAAAPKKAVKSVHKQVQKAGKGVQRVMKSKQFKRFAAAAVTGGAAEAFRLAKRKSPLFKSKGAKKSAKPTAQATADGDIQYTDENGNPITKEQYDALMAQYNAAPIVTDPAGEDYPGSNQSFDYGDGSESLTMPQPGGSAIMDPYAAPNDDFGPEDMGPAEEAESAFSPASESGEESFTSTRDVSESGIEPFADEENAEYSGDFEDEGGSDDDATEGSVEPAYGDEEEFFDEEPSGSNADVDTSDVYMADDTDSDEDGGEGDEYTSAEEPSVEGIGSTPTVAGMGLGTLALLGLGLYLVTRR